MKRQTFAAFVRGPVFVHWRDNFYVRLLGGCGWAVECAEAPHLASAVTALGFFSAVLVTDSPATYGLAARVLLAGRLGWDPATTDVGSARLRKGTKADSRAAVELAGDPGALALLAERNALDLRFHAAASEVFHAQVVAVLAERVAAKAAGGEGGGATWPLPSAAALEAALASLSGGGGSGGGEDSEGEGSARLFLPAEADRSGFGGHTAACRGEGGMASSGECRDRLLAVRRAAAPGAGPCDALSFKDGQCYLHRTAAADFYSDASMGHLFQRLRPSSPPAR